MLLRFTDQNLKSCKPQEISKQKHQNAKSIGEKLKTKGKVTSTEQMLKCLLRVKGLVICFYLGWLGSILQFKQNIIKVGSMSWLLTVSSKVVIR